MIAEVVVTELAAPVRALGGHGDRDSRRPRRPRPRDRCAHRRGGRKPGRWECKPWTCARGEERALMTGRTTVKHAAATRTAINQIVARRKPATARVLMCA